MGSIHSIHSRLIDTASFTYTFDDLKGLTSNMWSSEVSLTVKKEFRFKIGIHTYKPEDCSQCVMISLWHDVSEEQLNLGYEVSILNDKLLKCYTKNYECKYDPKYDNNVHVSNFILYDELIKEENEFLQNGALTLFCHVNIVKPSNLILGNSNNGFPRMYEDFYSILTTGDHSDFVLAVGDKEFKVHTNILSARSSVLKEMLSADLKENKQNRIEIIDVDVDVFKQLLNYIYCGFALKSESKSDESGSEYALELFIAGDKYLEGLKLFYAKHLSENLTVDTVANILLRADMHSAPELKSKCIKYITENSIKVMATDGWKQLVKANRSDLMAELFEDIAKAHTALAIRFRDMLKL